MTPEEKEEAEAERWRKMKIPGQLSLLREEVVFEPKVIPLRRTTLHGL